MRIRYKPNQWLEVFKLIYNLFWACIMIFALCITAILVLGLVSSSIMSALG